MNASQGRTRGTRLVQQIAQHEVVYDRHEALQRRKIRSYSATSVWPVTNAPVPAPACRRLTIDRRHATPARMPAASMVREVTRPSATASFCL
jgi:hypothetical protein